MPESPNIYTPKGYCIFFTSLSWKKKNIYVKADETGHIRIVLTSRALTHVAGTRPKVSQKKKKFKMKLDWSTIPFWVQLKSCKLATQSPLLCGCLPFPFRRLGDNCVNAKHHHIITEPEPSSLWQLSTDCLICPARNNSLRYLHLTFYFLPLPPVCPLTISRFLKLYLAALSW